MKNTKKAAVLLLSLFLALITAVPVFAQEGTYSITIENEASGHIYEAYQIFAGRLSTDDEGNVILSDITWGTGVNGEALLTALQAADAEKYGSCATAAEAAESIGATSATQRRLRTSLKTTLPEQRLKARQETAAMSSPVWMPVTIL